MARQDREGWNDDNEADRSGFQSGSGGTTSSIFGGVYRENRGTQPGWDTNSGGSQSGAKGAFYDEARKTTIPDDFQLLYGILVVLNGPRRFDLLKIGQRKTTIGRDQTDIILEDRAVGRQHAVITVSGDDAQDAEFKIYDRGADGLPSKTGTLVNGKHVSDAVLLRDKDHIRIGDTQLLFVQLWPGF